MTFGIIGTSIWQQNLPLLERLTLDRETRQADLERLKNALGLTELLYLATCNRVEVLYVTEQEGAESRLLHRLIDFFFRGKREISFFPNDFYHFTGREAMTHLFRTVASLESLVVGETQITGQFKQAWQDAAQAGLSGPMLDSLAQEALRVAKKVKRETDLGTGALSMASLAAENLYGQIGTREKSVVALVGSGSMTIKLARQIGQWPHTKLIFVNRTAAKAEQYAEDFGGAAYSLIDFIADPPQVDAIITATAAPHPVFDTAFAERLPETDHPVICIDLAIPRDFDNACRGHQRLSVVDIPALKSRAQGNLRKKFIAAGQANEIIKESVNKYLSDRIEVSLKPIFRNSYQESLALAERALSDLFATRLTSLSDEEKAAVTRTVTRLIGHSSFQPVKTLSENLATLRNEIGLDKIPVDTRVAG
ncbi:glutamyl-tRNA reductase [candidate division GN15 bacterium]|nr:glutamyl-tRNA reductase [candidate division GN15 bacterium]